MEILPANGTKRGQDPGISLATPTRGVKQLERHIMLSIYSVYASNVDVLTVLLKTFTLI